MKVVAKEIDKLKSMKHRGRIISEYIIYLYIEGRAILAFIELGKEARDKKIFELQYLYSVDEIEIENLK